MRTAIGLVAGEPLSCRTRGRIQCHSDCLYPTGRRRSRLVPERTVEVEEGVSEAQGEKFRIKLSVQSKI